MAKRNKQPTKQTANGSAAATPLARDRVATSTALATHPSHPPAKNPTLLGVSIVLFALWFAFLLATALLG